MENFTVLQLAGALLWGLFGCAPLFVASIAGAEENNSTPLAILAMGLQMAYVVAVYKAGWMR